VTGGSGSIAGADVTSVAVSCTSVIGNGALDPGFGEGGKVTGAFDDIVAVAVQPDGKIVAAGDRTLRRFLGDGSPDPGFGSGGAVTVDWGGVLQQINAVAVQLDGKIVVAGQNRSASTSDDFAVARFTTSGALDDGFGSDGEGRVVLVGQQSNLSEPDFAIARYTTAGALDDTFGTGGKLGVDFFSGGDVAECVAVQPDGKIIVGGVAQNGAAFGGALIRVLP
jgi:uncharacterized delta-60 repeat protein